MRRDTSLDAANETVRLTPSDPKAYQTRALVLSTRGDFDDSANDLKTAVALRPDDYLLWLRLGYAREQSKNPEGALAAYREASRLAPYYAQPRWFLGNLLLQMGRTDEAFVELRRAATSNPKLLAKTFDLAWTAYNGDAHAVEQATQPQTPAARLALARFFAVHGQAVEALGLFRATSGASDEDRRALVTALLAAKQFREAFEVWAASHGRPVQSSAITDGSFESEIDLNEPGFGWKIGSDLRALRVSLDKDKPDDGIYSLRIDWSGESDPSTAVISQLVLVEPKTRYRLNFAARTQELLTIGLPFVTVVDAGDEKTAVLMQSKTLPQGTSGWQDYITEFTTSETTRAVRIGIRRETCATPQCAVFGHVWFDRFSLERL